MIHKLFFCFFLIISFETVYSQNTPEGIIVLKLEHEKVNLPFGLQRNQPVLYPKTALVLSGGGARGISQIGVLKALSERKIPIDLLVGTSIGSILGGLYSTGYSPNELDSLAKTVDWQSLLSVKGNYDRRDMFIDQKVSEDKAILRLRVDGLKPLLPTSVNDGQKLLNQLNILSFQSPVGNVKNFDSLNTKFRAVCTDLESGNQVILKTGSLSKAMRASSSVSFVLSPIKMDSLTLVDGGLVANLPAKVAKDEKAEYIIAVNTTSPLHSGEELNLPWIVADQVVSIPMRLLDNSQLKYVNLLITPNIGTHNSTNFNDIPWLINQGYLSALSGVLTAEKEIDSIFRAKLNSNTIMFSNLLFDNSTLFPEIIKGYVSKGKANSGEILYDLYKLESMGLYSNLKATIDTSNSKSVIKFSGDINPAITSIAMTGVNLFSGSEIINILENLLGKPFISDSVLSASKHILRHYRQRGYSLATYEKISFDKSTGVLSLSLNEGEISDIILKGNEKTNATIIFREFPQQKGKVFESKNLENGLANLRSTNLFSNIVVSVEKTGSKNVLILEVEERESGLLRIGFKLDNENSPQVNFDIRDENIFGTGSELGMITYWSPKLTALSFEHRANRLFDTYFTYRINAFFKLHDIFTYQDDPSVSGDNFAKIKSGEYRELFYGFSFSIGTQIGRFANLIFQGKYEINEIQDRGQNSKIPYKTPVVSLKILANLDTEDKYPYPTSGSRFTAYHETAQSILGGEIGYVNFGFDYKGHYSIFKEHTLTMSAKMGFGDKTLPLSQQYSLGGQASFFGMSENEARGRQVFLSSIDNRYKLPMKIFFDTYISLRYDLGSIWEEQEAIRFQDLKHGIGATISLDTPIGPAEFSVGRSFRFTTDLLKNPISYGPVYFYFSIGYYY